MLRAVAARSRFGQRGFLLDSSPALAANPSDLLVSSTTAASSVRRFAADAAPAKPAAKGGKPAAGGKKKEVVKVTVKQPDSGRKYGHGSKHRPDAAERRAAEVQARMKAQAAASAGKKPAAVDSGIHTDDEELQVIYSLFEQGKIDIGDRDLADAAAAEEASGLARANQVPLALRETLSAKRRLMDSAQYEALLSKQDMPAELKGHLAVVSDDFEGPAQTDLDLSDADENALISAAGEEQLAFANKRGYAASSPIVMNARNRLSGLSKGEVAAMEAAAVQQRLAARASVDAAETILAGFTGGDVEAARAKAKKRADELFALSSDSDSSPADAASTSAAAAAAGGSGSGKDQTNLEAPMSAAEAAAKKARKLSADLAKLLEDAVPGSSAAGDKADGGGADRERERDGHGHGQHQQGSDGDGDGDDHGSADPRRDPIGRAIASNRPTSYNLLEDREGARLTGAGKIFPSKEMIRTRLGAEVPSDDEDDDGAADEGKKAAAGDGSDRDGGEGGGEFTTLREGAPLPKLKPSILRAPISRAIEEASFIPWKQLRGHVNLEDENDALLTEQAKQLLRTQVESKLQQAVLAEDSDSFREIDRDWRTHRAQYLSEAKDSLRQQYLKQKADLAARRAGGGGGGASEEEQQQLVSLSGDDSSDHGGDPLDMRYVVDRGQQYRDWKQARGLHLEDSSDAEAKALLALGVDEEEGTRIAPAFGDDIHRVPQAILEELATPYEFNASEEGQLYPDPMTVREASMTPDERMLDEQRKKLRELIERPLPIVNRPIWPFYAMVAAVDQVQQVVKGGMIASTRCCIIVGNGMGGCGFGIGKDKEPFNATKQALANAQRDMIHLSLHKKQLYHDLIGKRNSLYVIIRTMPSSSHFNNCPPFIQDVFEMVGIDHASAKVIGSRRRNPYNVVQALFDAFNHHYSPEHEAAKRGLRMQWQGADRFSPRSVYPFSPTGPKYPGANQRLSGMGKQRV